MVTASTGLFCVSQSDAVHAHVCCGSMSDANRRETRRRVDTPRRELLSMDARLRESRNWPLGRRCHDQGETATRPRAPAVEIFFQPLPSAPDMTHDMTDDCTISPATCRHQIRAHEPTSLRTLLHSLTPAACCLHSLTPTLPHSLASSVSQPHEGME